MGYTFLSTICLSCVALRSVVPAVLQTTVLTVLFPLAKVTFTAIREINNLIQLAKCKNVVVMHDSFLQEGELVIVLEFCEYDLSALLSVPGSEFAPAQAKYY